MARIKLKPLSYAIKREPIKINVAREKKNHFYLDNPRIGYGQKGGKSPSYSCS